eukprot:1016532-Ditylum_brightwellii.AAC.1
MDNKVLAALQQAIIHKKIKLQLAPPHVHSRNVAEQAIHTLKEHFIAACLMLNMLRPFRLNPRILAECQLNAVHDFNAMPLALLGTKIIIHEKPTVQNTWEPHSIDGWYIGPAPHCYWCYQVYVPKAHVERIADTVNFFPMTAKMPKTLLADATAIAALDLIEAIKNLHPATPFP